MKTRRINFSCLKKCKLFRKKTVNFRIIIIIFFFFFIEAVLTITRNLCFRAETTWFLRVPQYLFLEQKQEKKKKKKKINSPAIPTFLCEVVFVTGISIMKAGSVDVLS